MKVAALLISGQGQNGMREIEIHPGTTAADVLASVGLGNDYLLSIEGSGNRFAAEEVIYDAVPNGGKLRATPVAEVGREPAAHLTGGY
jgi:hypothetical protein